MPSTDPVDAPAASEPARDAAGDSAVAGIVLAAGAGTRFGGPKALAVGAEGTPWLVSAVRSLLAGGCNPVLVVLGAREREAESLLVGAFPLTGDAVHVVHAENWQSGMAASLRAGLARAAEIDPPPVAVAVVTVDVPSLNDAMVRRVVAAEPGVVQPDTLRQAFFSGRPGHPVVIGRNHWGALSETLQGDVGARPYLRAHAATIVDCSDLGSGADVDTRDRTP